MPETTSDINKLLDSISLREQQENVATAALTTQTLAQLRVKIDELPLKCRQYLRAAALAGGADALDPAALMLRHSRRMCGDMAEDYQLLLLRHRNARLQVKVDRNRREIQGLRNDLEVSRGSLRLGDVTADSVAERCRVLRQKLVSYEESLEKAMAKKLPVPDSLHPRALQQLISQLATLKVEEQRWKEQADEIIISREIRERLHSLRK